MNVNMSLFRLTGPNMQTYWGRAYMYCIKKLGRTPDKVQDAMVSWLEMRDKYGSDYPIKVDWCINRTTRSKYWEHQRMPDELWGYRDSDLPLPINSAVDLKGKQREVGNKGRLLEIVRNYAIETYRRELRHGKPSKTNEVFLRAALGEAPCDVAQAVNLNSTDESILRIRAINRAKKYLKPWVKL